MAGDALPVSVEGTDAVAAAMIAASGKVRAAVAQAIGVSAANLTSAVKAKLSDDVLRVKTGRLRRSIHFVLGGTDDAPSATVGTNVEYAAIHEFGGTTKAHVIEAVNAKVLAFKVGGETVFAKSVQHPGSKIPQRSYLRSALAEQAPSIKERIDAAVRSALPGG